MMQAYGWWAEVLAPLLLAGLSLGLGYSVSTLFRAFPHGWMARLSRLFLLSLLVLLFFTPSLLVAYIYGVAPDWLLKLRANSLIFNQGFYWLLLIMKMTPVAALFWLYGAKARVSASERHQWKQMKQLGKGPSLVEGLHYHWRWWMEHVTLGTVLIFLLIFPDFELASRLTIWIGREASVNPWALRVFDLRVRDGATMFSSWRLMWPYFATQAFALLILVILIYLRRSAESSHVVSSTSPAKLNLPKIIVMSVGGLWLLSCLLIQTIYPLVHLMMMSRLGMHQAIRDLNHWSGWETYGSSLFFASTSSLAVVVCLSLLVGSGQRTRWKMGLALILAMPGLMGALPLSMILLSLVNLKPFLFLRPTPIMAIFGIMLVLWPLGLLLRDQLFPSQYSSGLHLSTMLRAYGDRTQIKEGRRLNWQMLRGPAFAWVLSLWALAWCDVLITTPLAPAKMQGIFAYLYSVMHYGHVYKDAAFFLLAILIPLIALLLIWMMRKCFNRVGL